MKKIVVFLLLFTILFTLIGTISFALEKAPNEALEAAKSGADVYVQDMKDHSKQYGIDAGDDLGKISVENEGYKCYTISKDGWMGIKMEKTVTDLRNILTPSGIYVFPAAVGKKSVGLLSVAKVGDAWNVIQMEGQPNIKTYLNDIKKQIKGKNLNSDDVIFLYDSDDLIEGYFVKDDKGDYFISVVENPYLGLKRGVKSNLAKLIQDYVRYGSKNTTGQAVSATSGTAVTTKPAAGASNAPVQSSPVASSSPAETSTGSAPTSASGTGSWYIYVVGAVVVILLVSVCVVLIRKKSKGK
ncbi:MAG TPA: hypothetical protein VF941_19745 [Clostridia bacterium]